MMPDWVRDLHDKATEVLSTDWRVSNDGIYVSPERVRALCELAEALHRIADPEDPLYGPGSECEFAGDAIGAALASLEPARKEET